MRRLAAPRVDAVVEALGDALSSLPPPEALGFKWFQVSFHAWQAAESFHEEVKRMYSWQAPRFLIGFKPERTWRSARNGSTQRWCSTQMAPSVLVSL